MPKKNFISSQHSRVCEKHFVDTDFIMSCLFAESVGYTQRLLLQLKSHAVPTVIPDSKHM